MVVMTAKVNKKRVLLILGALVALIAVICLLANGSGGENGVAGDTPVNAATNDSRVEYLTKFGWQVTNSPVQTQQVRIPTDSSEVYQRYNALQVSQGFDLTQYAGKTVTRYVYAVENYPGAQEPVYATLLVYQDQVIGGDVTDTSAGGVVQGLQMPESGS